MNQSAVVVACRRLKEVIALTAGVTTEIELNSPSIKFHARLCYQRLFNVLAAKDRREL